MKVSNKIIKAPMYCAPNGLYLDDFLNCRIDGPVRECSVRDTVYQATGILGRKNKIYAGLTTATEFHGSYNSRQTKFKDFSRAKPSFQGLSFSAGLSVGL